MGPSAAQDIPCHGAVYVNDTRGERGRQEGQPKGVAVGHSHGHGEGRAANGVLFWWFVVFGTVRERERERERGKVRESEGERERERGKREGGRKAMPP